MQHICFIRASASDLRKQEAALQKREIRTALWFIGSSIVLFCFTACYVMHIETIMKAKGY